MNATWTHRPRPRVYISGPITKGDPEVNFEAGNHAQTQLIQAGFAPLNPMLTMKHPLANEIEHNVWIDCDLPWVSVADAVLRIPGESVGADKEVSFARKLGIPVFPHITELAQYFCDEGYEDQPRRYQGDPRVVRVFQELLELHAKKQRDYGAKDDPLANIRGTEDWQIPAWVGALLRGGDKIRRLRTFFEKGTLANEGVVDSFNDLAVYAVLARVLYEEALEDGRPVSKADCQEVQPA